MMMVMVIVMMMMMMMMMMMVRMIILGDIMLMWEIKHQIIFCAYLSTFYSTLPFCILFYPTELYYLHNYRM
jgi:hypothetical protein